MISSSLNSLSMQNTTPILLYFPYFLLESRKGDLSNFAFKVNNLSSKDISMQI